MTPLPPGVRELFLAPFAVDRFGVYVRDARGDLASFQFSGTNEPRGWGRHQYLDDGTPRHDAWCAWFDANVPAGAPLDDVARLLNEAWAPNPLAPAAG